MELSEEGLSRFFSTALPLLDERQRRLMAAAMVEALGRGGQARVAVAAEMSRNTLIVGSVELSSGRVRRFGSAGRVRVVSVLLILVRTCWWCWTHSWSRSRGGDPMSPLRWTTKSTRVLSAGVASSRASGW